MQPLKKEVLKLLGEKGYAELVKLASSNPKILRILISLSYDKKTLNSWRAIESIGLIAREISKTNPERVRNLVGRLLWMIRNESGGIGWSTPEILGEIVRNNPDLYSDFAPVIVSFHNEPPLRAGILRAIGRIGKINNELINYAVPVALLYLKSPEPDIRGYAVWALGKLGASEAVNEIKKLKDDNSLVIFYEDWELKEKTVGEVASEAIEKLKS